METICLITGSSGLIGSESVDFFKDKFDKIVGIDNDMRAYFFGKEASTKWNARKLSSTVDNFEHHDIDIRKVEPLDALFKTYGDAIKLIVHTAAQPSHDWAAQEPFTDFTVNANGTLNLLEMTRKHCPEATFILHPPIRFMATHQIISPSLKKKNDGRSKKIIRTIKKE